MDASTRIPLAAAMAALLLGGCAVGQRLGWTATTRGDDASASVRASCEDATRTLKGRPDHDTALRACLDAKTRQHLRS